MFHAQPEVIGMSSATEAGIAQMMLATATAKAPLLTGVLPMGDDPTSVEFATAFNVAGGTLLGVHGLQAANRELFAGGQQISADMITATEALRAIMATITSVV